MRKTILAVLVVATAVAAMGLTVNHYKNYQTLKNNTQEAVALDAVNVAEQRFAIERQTLVEKYVKDMNGLQVECQKGLSAFNGLSTFAQKSHEEPDCGSVPVR